MKTLKRSFFSFVVALMAFFITTAVVYAWYYVYVDDGDGGFTTTGSIWSVPDCTFSSCSGGDAKMASSNTQAKGTWSSYGTRIITVYAWIPNLTYTYSAVQYKVIDGTYNFTVTVNQNNWKGVYVTLGSLSGTTNYPKIELPATCVVGYGCGGSYRVFYDMGRFKSNS